MNSLIRQITEDVISDIDVVYENNPLNEELEKMYIPDCFIQKFTEAIVKKCIEEIGLECEDFENGNVFGTPAGEKLFQSITREYGPNKERGFNPVALSSYFEKMLKAKFGFSDE